MFNLCSLRINSICVLSWNFALTLILLTWCSINTPCHCDYVCGRVCSVPSRRVTWLRLKSVFNFLVVSSFCGFIVKCIALWWKLMCLLRPWIVWLLTITFTEKNYNLENGYSGKSQLTSNPDYYPKNYTTICVGYGAVFFGLSLVKKRK